MNPPAPTPPTDQPPLRDVKLRLPMGHLARLQGFRLVRRTTMSAILREALDEYFAGPARQALAAMPGGLAGDADAQALPGASP